MKLKKLIFLDFDGVVHPLNTSTPMRWKDAIASGQFFHNSKVERVIKAAEETGASIVITSAWRLDFSLDEINSVFKGLAIGKTPELHTKTLKEQNKGLARYQEVLLYLAANDLKAVRWIALDDQKKHYPSRNNIFTTDSTEGITDQHVEDIIKYLGKIE